LQVRRNRHGPSVQLGVGHADHIAILRPNETKRLFALQALRSAAQQFDESCDFH
jgi:hypothetical protein